MLCLPNSGCKTCDDARSKMLAKEQETQDMIQRPVRSQKARGVMALSRAGFGVPRFYYINEPEDINRIPDSVYPLFARPCPVRPRHGFVDSRIVNSFEEAHWVWNETRAADPEGEMLMMKPITAKANAVLTARSISIGAGNDGATSGKDCLMLPLIAVDTSRLPLKEAGITQAPFVEIVYRNNGEPTFVQLRDGPEIAAVGDYFPRDMKVQSVIKAEGDLLEFEQTILNAPDGAALDHVGGALTSHYAVHAMLKGMPVFLSRAPKVGEEIKANVDKPLPYDAYGFRRGVMAGISEPISHRVMFDGENNKGQDLHAILFATHQAMALRGEKGSWTLGYGAALMVRYGLIAAHGEARHGNRRRSLSRPHVYRREAENVIKSIVRAPRILEDFTYGAWGSGFGGKAWANCTGMIIRLDRALRKAFKSPGQTEIVDVITALHAAVNCAHNNGWWMNKFCPEEFMDLHARGDLRTIARAGMVIWEGYMLHARDRAIPLDSARWANLQDRRTKKVQILFAVSYGEGFIYLRFKTGRKVTAPMALTYGNVFESSAEVESFRQFISTKRAVWKGKALTYSAAKFEELSEKMQSVVLAYGYQQPERD